MGLKLEQFTFEAFLYAPSTALFEILREEEFAPVTNANGSNYYSPDSERLLVLRLHTDWVVAAGASFLTHSMRHYIRLIITLNAFSPSRLSRNFGQPARQEVEDDEEEEEEVEIDQRRLPADYDPSNFDPTEHRSPPTELVWRLVDEISGLTLSEISELGSIIMKKRGMTEPPTVGVMKAGAAAGLAGMTMKAAAASKIKIIKEVRSFTDLGLKEAKELVEKTPSVLKKGVSKEEGEVIIEKMKAVGAKVVLE
ncbi:hypothetical protein DITRI_Ditri08aG0170400 [Diplodiscus trichospermus]